MRISQKYINDLCYKIVGCAIEVHKNLGPGLLECIYEECLIEELNEEALEIVSQISIPLTYKVKRLNINLKLDLLVNNLVIVELKSVEKMIPLYTAQLLSYLKLTDRPKGLLINFNCENISEQLVPLVTEKFRELPIE